MVEMFKVNVRLTTRGNVMELDQKYPHFKQVYEDYLKSEKFKSLIDKIRCKYDDEYVQLFFRHSLNFLNFYLKENDIDAVKSSDKKGRKSDETDSDDSHL